MINVMSTGLDRSSWHQHLWALGRLTLINLAGKKLARRFAKKPWTMGFHHLQKLPHPTDPPKNQQIDKILVSEWSLWGPLFFLGFCSWISWAAHLLKILWHTAFHHMDPAKALAIRVSANILITANLHQICNPVLESQGSGLRQLTWHRPWDHSFSRICWLLFQQKV